MTLCCLKEEMDVASSHPRKLTAKSLLKTLSYQTKHTEGSMNGGTPQEAPNPGETNFNKQLPQPAEHGGWCLRLVAYELQ